MKPIPSRVHGILDYVVGVLLLLAPSLFGFADNDAARNTAYIVGIGTLLYSVFTAYELGVVKIIPYRVHLGLDLVAGIFLALSPWLLDFADRIVWPHLLVGLLEIGVALLSRAAATAKDPNFPHTSAAARH
jgi:hypothetical protein